MRPVGLEAERSVAIINYSLTSAVPWVGDLLKFILVLLSVRMPSLLVAVAVPSGGAALAAGLVQAVPRRCCGPGGASLDEARVQMSFIWNQAGQHFFLNRWPLSSLVPRTLVAH